MFTRKEQWLTVAAKGVNICSGKDFGSCPVKDGWVGTRGIEALRVEGRVQKDA